MKSFDDIRTLLIEQHAEFLNSDLGTERKKLAEISKYKDTPFPVIISGLRRAGKSTLLAQLAHKFYPKHEYFYINFEDDRFLNFRVSDFTKLHELLLELFGNKKVFLLDEIQNIEGWERFVARMITGGNKFYITGSNASLLSRELGTKLTGRYIPVELYPFSFEEYMEFKSNSKFDLTRATTVQKVNLKKAFSDYLKRGGIPQALRYSELPIHKTLYDDIINRDVAQRYNITETKPLRELAFYILSNISSPISYNKLKELLQLGSVNTVSSYIEHMEKAWLIFAINRYAFSVKKQQIANKKIYCIDTGLAKSVAFSFSEDRGKFLVNAAFLALRRVYGDDIYYYKTKKDYEVDFYISKKKLLIQVCQSLAEPATRNRELRALRDAQAELGKSTAIILTEDEKENINLGGLVIKTLPMSEWLLGLTSKFY